METILMKETTKIPNTSNTKYYEVQLFSRSI